MIEVLTGRTIDVKVGQKRADLHTHNSAGSEDVRHGMNSFQLVRFANRLGLSAIALTDHETITPAKRARAYAGRSGLATEVVIGKEITTANGHFIGLFLRRDIPEGLTLEETIAQIHKQGGFAIVPHPFLRVPKSLREDAMLRIVYSDKEHVYFDGYEVYSSGADDTFRRRQGKWPNTNEMAQEFYAKHEKYLGSPISSSDTHHHALGRAVVLYEGDLQTAIKDRKTIPVKLDDQEQLEILREVIRTFGRRILNKNSLLRRNLELLEALKRLEV